MTVRERQTIVRLPDTSRMKALVKVNESRVGDVEPGQASVLRTTASPRPLRAEVREISVVADSNRRWFNPDVREYPVELLLDETPPNLKPGMKVDATIYVAAARNVVQVPLTAIYSVGQTRFAFVPAGPEGGAGAVEPREVQVGLMNETHAEVQSGLDVGERVVLLEIGQGRELLERAGIEIAPPVDRGRDAARPAEGDKSAETADAKSVDAKTAANTAAAGASDPAADAPAKPAT